MSGEQALAQQVREVTAALARDLEREVPGRTGELAALFLEEIPSFRGDDAVRELMAASTASNLSTIADVLLHGLPLERIDVPAAAAAYARRFAQRDLPVESLLRAYRLGHDRLIRWFLRALGELDLPGPVLLGCTEQVTSVVGRYIDQVSVHLVEIYETERKLWTQRIDAARAVALRTVLLDEQLDAGTAEAMTGYRMHGWHLAAVAWVDEHTGDGSRQLEAVSYLLGTVLTGPAPRQRPLAVLDDTHTLWVWLAGTDEFGVDRARLAAGLADHPAVSVALGEAAPGLTGFRGSHREALRARTVAEAAGADGADGHRVTAFGEVGVAALLAENLDALGTWVTRTLGDLATDDEATARLRETVRVFLETGGSFTDAASRLHLHKNTVHYRVRKAEEVRGRPFSADRLDVEVALLACLRLGRRVLR
jgi:hypothetical protein